MPARNVGDHLADIIESAINDAALGDEYWWEILPASGTSPAGIVLAYNVVFGVRGPLLNSAPILAKFAQPLMAHQIINPAGEELIRTSVQAVIPALRAKFDEAKAQLLKPQRGVSLPQAGGPAPQQPPSPN
ncbi:MAG: hypothetical protein JWO67_6730 [Streptosporangiaceae bacterium]|nr:hypothetical protein [Streptosporangiaceae bacterium]